MKFLTGLTAAVLLCTNAVAGELDLSFNSDALRFFYSHDFAERDLRSDFGIANNSDEGYVLNASLYVTGLASDGVSLLKAGLGGRTGFVDGDRTGQTGFPVALGGFLQYTFPDFNRLSVRGDAWYAPDILTLGDLEKYQDYSVRLQYNVLQAADVYVGARYLKGEFGNGSSATFDNGLNLGVNIRF